MKNYACKHDTNLKAAQLQNATETRQKRDIYATQTRQKNEKAHHDFISKIFFEIT